MSTAVIICEYNPMHDGHVYQIARTKEKYDHVIAVMSGNFTQRCTPAIFDKWARTKCAITGGADMVVELPAFYATSSASDFALGGVAVANLLGAQALSFGSESGDVAQIVDTAKYLLDNEDSLDVKSGLKIGLSYANSVTNAMDEKHKLVMESPNNLLAVSYVRELLRTKSELIPFTVKRKGAGHDSMEMKDFPSASYIRNSILKGEEITGAHENLVSYYKDPIFEANMWSALCYALRSMSVDSMECIYGVNEGIEHRVYEAAKRANSYEELIFAVKCKRYPLSRVRRVVLNMLLNLTKPLAEQLKSESFYVRVLGVRKGCEFLISRASDVIVSPAGYESPLLQYDIHVSNVYSAIAGTHSCRDYTEKLIKI